MWMHIVKLYKNVTNTLNLTKNDEYLIFMLKQTCRVRNETTQYMNRVNLVHHVWNALSEDLRTVADPAEYCSENNRRRTFLSCSFWRERLMDSEFYTCSFNWLHRICLSCNRHTANLYTIMMTMITSLPQGRIQDFRKGLFGKNLARAESEPIMGLWNLCPLVEPPFIGSVAETPWRWKLSAFTRPKDRPICPILADSG